MIIAFMLLISILVLFLSASLYSYTVRDLENTSMQYTLRLLKEINFSIETYISNMKSMSEVVGKNDDVRKLMTFYAKRGKNTLTQAEQIELRELKKRVSSHMQTVANTRNDITNIAVISKKGDVILSDPLKQVNEYSEYNIRDWYLKPLSYTHDIIVSPSHVQNLVKNEYKWVISISKAILDADTGEVTGVMVIDLNYKSIENICINAQLGKDGYIYLIDNDKNIIYHPQQQLIYSGVKSELVEKMLKMDAQTYFSDSRTHKIYTKNYSPLTEWSAVGVVNMNELMKDKQRMIQFYMLLAGIAIISAGLFAVTISRAITKPIKMLESTMHRVEQGDFTVQSEVVLNNEIGHLSKTFNVMISKIKLLMEAAVSNEKEKRKNEIRALQAQINPHFLYNTLDTIIWMSAGGKNEEVVEVTSALAKLFRTSISEGENLIPLAVEIENIKSYLVIQKMRYKDKLNYQVDIPAELLALKTPKLILQPIVENAVYHGIKLSPDGGDITITAGASDGILRITVEDSGVGMSEERVSQIFSGTAQNHAGNGIGVLNVHNRIQLCFGQEYGLFYQSAQGQGTRVDIRLPMIQEGEDNIE